MALAFSEIVKQFSLSDKRGSISAILKCIPVQEAVGSILCHDITQILPGEFKGRRFKKGHIIQEEDIPVLLSLGKDNIYVWENLPGMVHENAPVPVSHLLEYL